MAWVSYEMHAMKTGTALHMFSLLKIRTARRAFQLAVSNVYPESNYGSVTSTSHYSDLRYLGFDPLLVKTTHSIPKNIRLRRQLRMPFSCTQEYNHKSPMYPRLSLALSLSLSLQ